VQFNTQREGGSALTCVYFGDQCSRSAAAYAVSLFNSHTYLYISHRTAHFSAKNLANGILINFSFMCLATTVHSYNVTFKKNTVNYTAQ